MSSAINLSGMFPGASPGLQDIIRQLQQAQNKANEANEKRYQDILGLYGNLGQAGMTRIGQAEQQGQAKATQDLTSRGLGNTTVTSAVSRGIASDAELARQSLQEGVAQQKAGVMERRTDQGPDMGMYANLLQQASQAGGQNQGAIIAENARRDAESRARYREMTIGGSSSAQSYTPSV
jgi:hypothetical protein